jgi:hypothetical protein
MRLATRWVTLGLDTQSKIQRVSLLVAGALRRGNDILEMVAAMHHRSHHFVPAFVLAGFTEEGTRDGGLWVLDRVQRSWRPSTPNKCGCENHFYAIDRPGLDPLEAEKAFGTIENHTANIVRAVIARNALPTGDDEVSLINFVALQDTRTPTSRIQANAERQRFWKKQTVRAVAAGKEDFERRLVANDPTLPDFPSFEAAVKGASDLDRLVFGDQTDDVGDAFKMAQSAMDKFNRLHWTLVVPHRDASDFVCSDVPVMHWIPSRGLERICGLGPGAVMPIGRRHALAGSVRSSTPRLICAKPSLVGAINRGVALAPSRNVYAAAKDFQWLDERNKLRRAADIVAPRGGVAIRADAFVQEFFR